MDDRRMEAIRKINYLTTEMDSLYHQASLKLGLADSVSFVLYTLCDQGGSCLLNDICKRSGLSKQTIHSAVRGLEADGMLYLEQHTGRAKRATLTPAGRDCALRTVARLRAAEVQAFDTWTEEEIRQHICLMEKYAQCFRQKIEAL